MIQIGRKCSETFGSKTISNIFDVVVQAPPLLDNNNAGAAIAGDVSGACTAIAFEFDHLAH